MLFRVFTLFQSIPQHYIHEISKTSPYLYKMYSIRPQNFQLVKRIPVIFTTAGYSSAESKHTYSFKAYVRPVKEDHDKKNMRLKRPMSPHLEIYGPTLPAMTSIAQRGTGAFITTCSIIFAWWGIFSAHGINSLIAYIQSWNFPGFIIWIIKLIAATAFAFHYYTGIKFVCFNLGKFLDLKVAYQAGWATVAAAAASGFVYSLY